jgi:hypothetical protein
MYLSNETEISYGSVSWQTTLNGADGKPCDIDGQVEGRLSGNEGVNLSRNGAVGFIA